MAVPLFLMLFVWGVKVYDVATATWFAMSIGLLARRQMFAYYLLFPIGCLNRETAFLMVILFLVHFGKAQWAGVLYQATAFIAIRVLVMIAYADLPGVVMLVRPIENLQLFAEHLVGSIVHWMGFAGLTWLCVRQWHRKPLILRQAFLVFGPLLMLMYLVLGVSFEIRVFAELYPVVFALIYPLEVL
jgi:hypothetical protein